MAPPRRIEEPKQLLVEGKDQENFFKAFIQQFAFQSIQIQDFGGIDELRSFLQAFTKSPGFTTVSSIGIIRDAERSAAFSAFRSVRDSLRNVDLPVPSAVGKRTRDHTHPGQPAVTVLILPDGTNPGMLETLLCESFANDPVNDCIDDFFKCADALPDTSSARRDKARAHVYLATKSHPEVSVGVAAQKDYWCLDHEVFSDVRSFLKGL